MKSQWNNQRWITHERILRLTLQIIAMMNSGHYSRMNACILQIQYKLLKFSMIRKFLLFWKQDVFRKIAVPVHLINLTTLSLWSNCVVVALLIFFQTQWAHSSQRNVFCWGGEQLIFPSRWRKSSRSDTWWRELIILKIPKIPPTSPPPLYPCPPPEFFGRGGA